MAHIPEDKLRPRKTGLRLRSQKFTGSLLLGDKFEATNSVILTAVLAKSHRTTTKVYG